MVAGAGEIAEGVFMVLQCKPTSRGAATEAQGAGLGRRVEPEAGRLRPTTACIAPIGPSPRPAGGTILRRSPSSPSIARSAHAGDPPGGPSPGANALPGHHSTGHQGTPGHPGGERGALRLRPGGGRPHPGQGTGVTTAPGHPPSGCPPGRARGGLGHGQSAGGGAGTGTAGSPGTPSRPRLDPGAGRRTCPGGPPPAGPPPGGIPRPAPEHPAPGPPEPPGDPGRPGCFADPPPGSLPPRHPGERSRRGPGPQPPVRGSRPLRRGSGRDPPSGPGGAIAGNPGAGSRHRR